MPWVRLDDGMYTHPKVISLTPSARWLFVAGICYANQNATDGFISRSAAEGVGMIRQSGRAVAELVSAGLWERSGSGYVIHDYHDYQPSRDKILADRRAAAQRQQRWRTGDRGPESGGLDRAGGAGRNGARNGVTNGVSNAVTDGVTDA